jgi:tripartite-type tricarboxylate transporter receptor subunit TctC
MRTFRARIPRQANETAVRSQVKIHKIQKRSVRKRDLQTPDRAAYERKSHLSWVFALLASLPQILDAQPARSQSPADFYKGKTIRITVGFVSGGGFDANARLLARYIGQYIPGNPNVIVQNMPGASSLKAVQYLDSGAPTDGTVITAFSAGLTIESLTKPAQVPVDFAKFSWIGSMTQEIRACYVRSELGLKTWEDVVNTKVLNFGETGPGSGSYVDSAILRELLGVKIKSILGYGGTAEKNLGIERGELDGNCVSFSSIPKHWLAKGFIKVISRGSSAAAKDMPADTPYVVDLIKDPEKKRLVQFLLLPVIMGRPYIVSKEVPSDRVAALRGAFKATVEDPALLAEADKLDLHIIGPMLGDEAAAYVAQLQNIGPALIAAARKITAE